MADRFCSAISLRPNRWSLLAASEEERPFWVVESRLNTSATGRSFSSAGVMLSVVWDPPGGADDGAVSSGIYAFSSDSSTSSCSIKPLNSPVRNPLRTPQMKHASARIVTAKKSMGNGISPIP
jgi:hypothetical protein